MANAHIEWLVAVVGMAGIGKSTYVQLLTGRRDLSGNGGRRRTTSAQTYAIRDLPTYGVTDTEGTDARGGDLPWPQLAGKRVCIVLVTLTRWEDELDDFLIKYPGLLREQVVVRSSYLVPNPLGPGQPPRLETVLNVDAIRALPYRPVARAVVAVAVPRPVAMAMPVPRADAPRRTARAFFGEEFTAPMRAIISNLSGFFGSGFASVIPLHVWLSGTDPELIRRLSRRGETYLKAALAERPDCETLMGNDHFKNVLVRVTNGAIIPHVKQMYPSNGEPGGEPGQGVYGDHLEYLYYRIFTEKNMQKYDIFASASCHFCGHRFAKHALQSVC
jgi:hypothetical protein